jgi:hypothetical protein
MALKEVCDVYGTTKAVEKYRVTVSRIETVEGVETENVVKDWIVAFGPRGFARFAAFLDKGMNKPDTKAAAVSKPGTDETH